MARSMGGAATARQLGRVGPSGRRLADLAEGLGDLRPARPLYLWFSLRHCPSARLIPWA